MFDGQLNVLQKCSFILFFPLRLQEWYRQMGPVQGPFPVQYWEVVVRVLWRGWTISLRRRFLKLLKRNLSGNGSKTQKTVVMSTILSNKKLLVTSASLLVRKKLLVYCLMFIPPLQVTSTTT